MKAFTKTFFKGRVLAAFLFSSTVLFIANCANPTAPNTTSNNSTGSGSKTNITTNTSSSTTWNYYSVWTSGSTGSGNGQFSGPQDIAIDSSGKLYVTDYNNHRVQVFNSSGNYLSQWGSSGTGNGQFNSPTGISISSDDKIYVCDTGNYRVQVFNTSGTYLTKFGSLGTGNGQFDTVGPTRLVVESTNYVMVVDSGNSRIQKFGTNGVYIAQYSPHKTEMTLDGTNYWVCTGTYIQKYNFGGTQLAQWAVGAGACLDAAVDQYGRAFVLSNGYNVKVIDTSTGTKLFEFAKQGSNPDELNFANGIVLDSSTNVYIAETTGCRIQKFSWSSKTVTTTTVTTNITQ